MAHVTAPRPKAGPLPRPIRRALGRIERRLKGIKAIRGLGTAGIIAAVGAVAGMAVDFFWVLPQGIRWGVWAAWVVAVLVPLLNVVSSLFARRNRSLELAAVIERGAPEIGERLTNAVDLLDGPAHGSPSLIAALAEDAAERVGAIDLAVAAPSGKAWRRFAFGTLALAAVAAPAMVKDDPFGRLARRFLSPWATLDRVGLYVVRVTPGNTYQAIGEGFAVNARVEPRFGKTPVSGEVSVEWRLDDGRLTHRVTMDEPEPATGATRAFKVDLRSLPGSLKYRVVSQSGESPWYRVTAVDRPAVTAITAKIEPPAYTRLPSTNARNPARIEAWEDSRVTLTVTTNTPVREAEVAWPGLGHGSAKPETLAVPFQVDSRTATGDLKAEATGDYAIKLRDAHGITSRPEPPRRVIVKRDEPPVVTVRGGEGTEEARPDDTLRAGIAARDDFAVATAELHYTIDRAGSAAGEPEKGVTPVKLPGLGTASARGEAVLSLKALKLKPGDVVGYRVRVTDNRPAPRGPNEAWSEPRRLTVVASADPLWARRNQAGREEVQKKLDALKKAAAENRQETEQLRYAADAVQRGNGKWDRDRQQALARREAAARALIDSIEEFARDVAKEPPFRPLARPARQVAGVEAEAARVTLDEARQAEGDAERFADLRKADTRLAAVSGRLEDLQRDLNALAEREADRRQLQALAERQAGVAEKAEKADDPKAHAAPDRARLDQLAADQNAVGTELDALLRKSPALRADVLAAQAAEADDLAKRARDLAERQRDEARRATDLTKKAEALKELADDQRALEDDARRLALDVDRPLTENGRAGLNTGPLRDAAPPIERGDLPQARHQLQAAENEIRRLARDLEDAPGDLKAMARRLTQRQDQLANDLNQALGGSRNKDKGALKAEERADVAKALAPLAGRQKEIAKLAAQLAAVKRKDDQAEPRFPRETAEQAKVAAEKAASAVRAADNPQEVEARAREARDALNRLADELPDVWKRHEPVQRAFNEARQEADDAAHQVDRHVRETDRPHDKDQTPARAAAELAQRLAPLADQARRAADKLEASRPTPRQQPQRDRAARRARALADAIDAARAQAPKDPNAPAGFDANRAKDLRGVLTASAIGTRAAFERYGQKLGGATPDDDLAAELAEDQQANAGKPKADDQRRIATALRNIQAPDAPLEQVEAVRLADRAAKVLEQPKADDKGRAEAVKQAAEAAEALADRLADRQTPRDRAEALARSERGLNDADVPTDPAAEAARQRAVAAELARLPVKANDPAERAVHEVLELADRTLRPEPPEPGQHRPTPAERTAARAQAAHALEALAGRLPDTLDKAQSKAAAKPDALPRDPDLPIAAEHAARARELARRERKVRERLQAVLGEKVAPQQDLRRESTALGREMADLRDRASALSDRARGPANEAASALGEHTPRAMDEAVNQLAQGMPDPARAAQRRAAQLAEQGAQNAEDLAAALHAETPPQAAGADAKHRPDANGLAEAREAMARATDSLGQARQPAQRGEAFDAARKAMRGAAEKLQAAAESSRAQDAEPAEGEAEAGESLAHSQPSSGEPKGGKAGVATPETLRDLQDLVRKKTGRNWGELPGHLRTEILQMSQGRYRDDYARLIQLYFREIAAGADAKRGDQP